MQAVRRRWQPLVLAALATVLVIGLVGAMSARGNGDDQEIRFPMVRSAAAANAGCLANASAKVKVENEGAGRGAHAQGPGASAEHELRLLRDPGAQHAVRPVVVPGRHRDRPPRQRRADVRRPLQHRDVHRRPGHRARRRRSTRRSRTPPRTRRRRRCTRSTSACGSTRRPTRSRPAARPPSRRSTATTPPASRCSAPGTSPTTRARCGSSCRRGPARTGAPSAVHGGEQGRGGPHEEGPLRLARSGSLRRR